MIAADDGRTGTIAPSLGALAHGFLVLGLVGFGGVMPHAEHILVERRRWLTLEDFHETLALCQLLPGGNICNMAVAVGQRFHGAIGAAVALVALLAAPSTIVILLGYLYSRFHDDPHVQHLFAGMAAAAAGLVASLAIRMIVRLRGDTVGIVIATGVFAAIALFRLSMLPVLVAACAIGFAARRWWPR